ncbi:hypothetical protein TcCL_ESM06120 [Trypanosoma cruzi]|nr:hypothetical protein TcCL_ESM06120 [Trypanosoma cruzi]
MSGWFCELDASPLAETLVGSSSPFGPSTSKCRSPSFASDTPGPGGEVTAPAAPFPSFAPANGPPSTPFCETTRSDTYLISDDTLSVKGKLSSPASTAFNNPIDVKNNPQSAFEDPSFKPLLVCLKPFPPPAEAPASSAKPPHQHHRTQRAHTSSTRPVIIIAITPVTCV